MKGLLENRMAVVTGASGDIGSDIALLFAHQGADVVATYNRGEEKALALRRKADSAGVSLAVERLDVSSEEEVKRFFSNIAAKDGGVDVLVNAVGHSDKRVWFSKPEELRTEDWLEVLKVDLVGSFNCSREAAKLMRAHRGGSIVNFSSAAGVTGHIEGLPYTAAKAGLIALTKSLAYLFGPKVRVNAVAPGNIDAGSIRWYSQEQRKGLAEEASLKRLGSSSEVASAVLFLASDMSSFITGQTLLVDGGI